ncbi:hypothetical protein ACP70R_018259 [Stipagrostis hirtigluma subsp. patula]
MDRARRNGAWDIELVQPSASTARSDRCSKLLLMWFGAIGVVAALYVFAGYVWGSVAAALLLVAGGWFTCYWFRAAPPEPPLLPALRVAVPVQVMVVDGGLSQEDVDAIPAFEYHRKAGAAAVEQCAVCINVVRDGETVRRLPACGHAFHAPCVDGWLRAHATCPMCRADVKVAGEPPAEATV